MRFHRSSPAFSGQFEALRIEATPETNAWIWTYAVIMREEGKMIGKPGEEFFASVFSGLGWSGLGRGLDLENRS
jgi:hypothetical protein